MSPARLWITPFNLLRPSMVSLVIVSIGSGDGLVPLGTKPLPDPMLIFCELNPKEQTLMKFESKYTTFLST